MDPKVIEMNNLRVLNDYLNQTIDVLVRSPRAGNGHTPGFGQSFAGSIPGGGSQGMGTDVVYGPTQSPFAPFGGSPFGGSQMFGGVSPFAPTHPFTGAPLGQIGAGYGTVDPYLAQRGAFGGWQQAWPQAWQQGWQGWQQPWGQGAWTGPMSEATRQAQITQALAAKQSVFEAMCRMCGIPC